MIPFAHLLRHLRISCSASTLLGMWWRRSCTVPIPFESPNHALLWSSVVRMSLLPVLLQPCDPSFAVTPPLRGYPFAFSVSLPLTLSMMWEASTVLIYRLPNLHRLLMCSCVTLCPHRLAIRICFPAAAGSVQIPASRLLPPVRSVSDSAAISSGQ